MIQNVNADDGISLVAEGVGPDEAPALLFLNSIGCDRRMWLAQTSGLQARFRCISFDARGHGASAASAGDYTIERLAWDALAVLDHFEAERAHVCGLSLGGVIAQWLAIHTPGRLLRLTLANTASRIGSSESWEARRSIVLGQGLASIADLAMERFFSVRFRERQPDVVAHFWADLGTGSATGYAGCCAALRDADLRSEIGAIRASTLVIGGSEDVSTPPDKAVALAAAIPRARLVMLPAAHLSNIEEADAFTEALRAHLESS